MGPHAKRNLREFLNVCVPFRAPEGGTGGDQIVIDGGKQEIVSGGRAGAGLVNDMGFAFEAGAFGDLAAEGVGFLLRNQGGHAK